MNRILLTIAISIALASLIENVRANHSMVMIASRDSEIQNVSPIDIRKLYLGFAVSTENGRPIRPISNISHPVLWEIFLQDVMGMSARSYDRRLLTLTLQSGRRRPDRFENLQDLLDRVESDESAIAFVWQEDIEERSNIKVLRILWQE